MTSNIRNLQNCENNSFNYEHFCKDFSSQYSDIQTHQELDRPEVTMSCDAAVRGSISYCGSMLFNSMPPLKELIASPSSPLNLSNLSPCVLPNSTPAEKQLSSVFATRRALAIRWLSLFGVNFGPSRAKQLALRPVRCGPVNELLLLVHVAESPIRAATLQERQEYATE